MTWLTHWREYRRWTDACHASSRPMPIIGNGIHELRLKDRSGAYRVFYVLPGAGVVYVLHAFQKKTQATPKSNLDVARKRLKEVKL